MVYYPFVVCSRSLKHVKSLMLSVFIMYSCLRDEEGPLTEPYNLAEPSTAQPFWPVGAINNGGHEPATPAAQLHQARRDVKKSRRASDTKIVSVYHANAANTTPYRTVDGEQDNHDAPMAYWVCGCREAGASYDSGRCRGTVTPSQQQPAYNTSGTRDHGHAASSTFTQYQRSESAARDTSRARDHHNASNSAFGLYQRSGSAAADYTSGARDRRHRTPSAFALYQRPETAAAVNYTSTPRDRHSASNSAFGLYQRSGSAAADYTSRARDRHNASNSAFGLYQRTGSAAADYTSRARDRHNASNSAFGLYQRTGSAAADYTSRARDRHNASNSAFGLYQRTGSAAVDDTSRARDRRHRTPSAFALCQRSETAAVNYTSRARDHHIASNSAFALCQRSETAAAVNYTSRARDRHDASNSAFGLHHRTGSAAVDDTSRARDRCLHTAASNFPSRRAGPGREPCRLSVFSPCPFSCGGPAVDDEVFDTQSTCSLIRWRYYRPPSVSYGQADSGDRAASRHRRRDDLSYREEAADDGHRRRGLRADDHAARQHHAAEREYGTPSRRHRRATDRGNGGTPARRHHRADSATRRGNTPVLQTPCCYYGNAAIAAATDYHACQRAADVKPATKPTTRPMPGMPPRVNMEFWAIGPDDGELDLYRLVHFNDWF